MPSFNWTFENSDNPPLVSVEIGVQEDAAAQAIVRGEKPAGPFSTTALIDTGAVNSCLSPAAVKALRLRPMPNVWADMSRGRTTKRAPCYAVNLAFPGTSLPEMHMMLAEWEELPDSSTGHHVIIGRDVLARCILIYNGPKGLFTLAV